MKRVISFNSRSELATLRRRKTGEFHESTYVKDNTMASTGSLSSMCSSSPSSSSSSSSDLDFSAWPLNKRNEVVSVYCYCNTKKGVTIGKSSSVEDGLNNVDESSGCESDVSFAKKTDPHDFAAVTQTLYTKAGIFSSRHGGTKSSLPEGVVETRYMAPVPISPRSSAEFDLHDVILGSAMSDEEEPLPPPFMPKTIGEESSTSSMHNSRKKKKGLTFNENVTVIPVPRACDLTDAQRQNVWGTKNERMQAMKRNAMEYAYEGMDWRRVLEEDKMMVREGERIHPVHVEYTASSLPRKPESATTYVVGGARTVRWHTVATKSS